MLYFARDLNEMVYKMPSIFPAAGCDNRVISISGVGGKVAFGAIISTVGCFKGLHADKGAEGVGLATTASVVLSIILIFIADYFMTVLLYVDK